jgi:hypothetical protein
VRIYIFKSDAKNGLHAFAGDLMGSKLPEQFRPWRAIGAVGPDNDPPYKLSREEIEHAIESEGFQLWRLKPKGETAADMRATGARGPAAARTSALKKPHPRIT